MTAACVPGQPAATKAVPAAVPYALVAIVGATALSVSAYYLWRLALAVGMPAGLAWSLPVTLDAGAAGATIVWVAGAAGAARVWARGIALSALAATLAGNALSHLIDERIIPVTPALVIAIGVVYPAMVAALAHLALTLTTERSALVMETVEAVGDASVMDQEPLTPRSPAYLGVAHGEAPSDASGDASLPGRSRRRRSTPQTRRRWIASRLDAGHAVTGGEVERRYGTRNGAREVAQVMAQRQMTGAA